MSEEKKLTDEEIIKALDICYNDVNCSVDCPYFNLNGRNFCQDKELYKDLKRIVLEHSEQKAEIERLKKRHGVALLRNDDLDLKNYNLKKQVDELSDHLSEKQNALWDLQDDFDNLLAEGKQQAIKDTAKEIYSEINSCIEKGQEYCGLDWRGLLTAKTLILVYCKKKGVEVE